MMSSLLLISSLFIQAVIPLTETQQTQVATATDYTGRLDESALYALMNNALHWEDGDETGAMIPDLQSIAQSPTDHRGQLFLIEGQYAGEARLINNLSRSGPWDNKLQQWGIVTDRQRDEVAIVYLVDPPRPIDKPLVTGTGVRVVARFCKVLRDIDRNKKPTDFLIFVGKSAKITEKSGPKTPPIGVSMMLLVVIMVGAWIVIRRMARVRPLRTRDGLETTPAHASLPRDPDRDPNALVGDLPDDPADALDLLQARHDERDKS